MFAPALDDGTTLDRPWETISEPVLDESVPRPDESVPSGPKYRRRVHLAPSTARVLPSVPTWLDWFAHRFAPGEATLLFGPARTVDRLLEIFYAASAAVGGRLSLIEGANRFPAYQIAERGRAFGLAPEAVLRRIRLARAFTAYQLVALVDGWAREVHRTRPTWLVAHELPALFYDGECPEEERGPLLEHVAETLTHVAETSARPLLLTCAGGFGGFPGLRERGPRFFDLVRVTSLPHRLVLDAYRDGARLSLVARAPGQLGLETFVDPSPEEVIAWDGPSPRTARRSRSG
jgi:hypothetical protein